jgi:hypothetical protein
MLSKTLLRMMNMRNNYPSRQQQVKVAVYAADLPAPDQQSMQQLLMATLIGLGVFAILWIGYF